MEYRVKINFADSFDVYDTEDEGLPFVSNVKLKDSTSLESNITLGTAVSKQLTFSLYNAPIEIFDGEQVTLFIDTKDEGDTPIDLTAYELTDEEVLNDLFVVPEIPDGGNEFDAEDLTAIADDIEAEGTEYEYDISTDPDVSEGEEELTDNPENEVYREEVSEGTEDVAEPEEPDDWIELGTFYVTDIKNNNGVYNIVALDGFILMNGKYVPTNNVDTVENMYADFIAQMEDTLGLAVNYEPSYPNLTIIWDYDTTYREAAGYFAGLLGGYATFDRSGALDIRQYMKNEIPIDDPISIQLNNDGTVYIMGMRCDKDITALENWVSTSAEINGYSIDFVNPFMTSSILNDIFTTYYQYLEYTPAKLTLDWYANIQAGDLIFVNETWILITNQTIDFASGTTTIDSLGTTATLSDGQITDPTERKMQRVQTLLADRIEANTADIVNLNADKADIDFANVNQASVGTEWVQKLLVQGNVVANNGTVYELDAIHFNTNFLEAGSIKADKLILKSSTDGLYYQLNINADGFDIDALTEEERAKLPDSLHADVIMANTITTKHITVQNLEGTNGWINLAEGTFQYVNFSGNGISWDGNELYIRANRLLLESGADVAETIAQMWKDYQVVWTGVYGTGDYSPQTLVGQVYVYRYGEDVTDLFSDYIFSWVRKTDYGYETIQEHSKTFHYDQTDTMLSDTFVLQFDDELEVALTDENEYVLLAKDNDDDGYGVLVGKEGLV